MTKQLMSVSFAAWLLYSAVGVALQNPPAKAPSQNPSAPVNADAKILQDFNERVGRYVELRKAAQKDSPPMKETKDQAKIKAAQETLAAKIVAAKAGARHGDIFTPEIQLKFKRMLNPALKGADGPENRETIRDETTPDLPARYKVYTKYPEKAGLSTMPADVLASLPKLPEDLQYRFVEKDMILYDSQTDLIIDFVPNVLP
jgi:hypothetical protein